MNAWDLLGEDFGLVGGGDWCRVTGVVQHHLGHLVEVLDGLSRQLCQAADG